MIYKNEVLFYHNLSIEKYGGSKGIRDEGALESAIERLMRVSLAKSYTHRLFRSLLRYLKVL
jgi:prophage maintenance system killer protein